MGFAFTIKHDGVRVDGNDSWFMPVEMSSGEIGLRVACAEYKENLDDEFAYAVEMLLEAGLGEIVASSVRGIDVVRTASSPAAAGFRPLSELAEFMTTLIDTRRN